METHRHTYTTTFEYLAVMSCYNLTQKTESRVDPRSRAPRLAVTHSDIYTWNINILHDCLLSAATLGADTTHTLHVSY